MEQDVIIHYSEIGIKGRNRIFFENRLIQNIRQKLADFKVKEIRNLYGRILLTVNKAKPKEISAVLQKIPGIKYFAFTVSTSWDMQDLQNASLNLLKQAKFNSFRVSTKRASKNFPLNSQQVNQKIGAYILAEMPSKKVNLSNPDVCVYLELINQQAFIYQEKFLGIGGLPVGASGKVLSLISSGIDSPVASFRMMKRGAQVLYLHFHSYPQTSRETIKNVEDIVKVLQSYQVQSKLYLAPFLDFQKEVVAKGDAKDRVILYRRMMLRVAEEVAAKEKINTIVTGESLGQVASQTLGNMYAISKVCQKTQVLKPLICYDKEEIISEATSLGTYDISSRVDEDCCSLFIPARPNTSASVKEIERQERKIDIGGHLKKIIDSLEIKNINNK
jgi:thiamine biosynthesis protein ThiI